MVDWNKRFVSAALRSFLCQYSRQKRNRGREDLLIKVVLVLDWHERSKKLCILKGLRVYYLTLHSRERLFCCNITMTLKNNNSRSWSLLAWRTTEYSWWKDLDLSRLRLVLWKRHKERRKKSSASHKKKKNRRRGEEKFARQIQGVKTKKDNSIFNAPQSTKIHCMIQLLWQETQLVICRKYIVLHCKIQFNTISSRKFIWIALHWSWSCWSKCRPMAAFSSFSLKGTRTHTNDSAISNWNAFCTLA